jgi:hypothetical protein
MPGNETCLGGARLEVSLERCSRLPALAVVAFYELCGLGAVGGFHAGAVPFHADAFADAEGDAAEEDDFGEVAGDVEVRVRRYWLGEPGTPSGVRFLGWLTGGGAALTTGYWRESLVC